MFQDIRYGKQSGLAMADLESPVRKGGYKAGRDFLEC